jgi:sulfur carrier protein
MEGGRPARPAGRGRLVLTVTVPAVLCLLLRLVIAKIDGMKIVINGQEETYDPITLAQLIEQLGMKQDRVAVELNRDIVPRAKWTETNLAEGDRLEIVHFVGGGLS